MGRPTTWSVVEAFQNKADIKDLVVQEALGLNEELLEALWTGFNAMSSATGSSIPDFEKLLGKDAEKMIKKLSKAGAVKEHSKGGVWVLTNHLLGKMVEFNKADAAAEEGAAKKAPGKKKSGAKKSRRKKTGGKKIGKKKRVGKPGPKREPAQSKKKATKLDGMTISEIETHLDMMNQDIERLTKARNEMHSELVVRLKRLTKQK